MTFKKKAFLNIPEYLLIAAVLFYWMSAGLVINYIAIVLLVMIIFQMIYKNKVIGIAIPTFLILTSLYMILALFSEVSEFPSFNAEAQTLLLVGLAYFFITIIASTIMIIKYTSLSGKKIED